MAHQDNTAVEISVGNGAKVDHVSAERLRQAGIDSVHARACMSAAARASRHAGLVTAPALSRHQLFLRFAGEHSSRSTIAGARAAQGSAARRHHAGGRPRRATLRRAESCSRRARRRVDGRVPGQDHRAPRRAEDGRQHDEPGRAARRRRHHEQQAGTRDLRRRRAVARMARPAARSTTTCCSICAPRHSQAGGRGADAAGLSSAKRSRLVENEAVRAVMDDAVAAWLEGESLNDGKKACPHPPKTGTAPARRPFDLDCDPRRFPDPLDAGLRQAARLSRQCRLGPEAQAGDRARWCTPIEHEYANVHRGLHSLANAATEAYEDAREKVRGFLNAASTDEIIFTRSATEAINLVAASFGAMAIGEGDEIVLSIMEHHSNIVPWHFHRERQGAVIKWAEVDEDGNSCSSVRDAADRAHQDRRHHPHVQRARHGDADQGDHPHRPCARHPGAWSTAARARCICPSTCRISTPTSTSSPATRFTARPASACSTASASGWSKMPPYQGGGEMINDVTRDDVTYNDAAAPLRGGNAADRAGDRARRGDRLHESHRARRASWRRRTRCATTRMERLGAMNSLRIFGTRAGQGRHRVVRDARRACARRRDGHRPVRRRGARRHALRPAAARHAMASPRPAGPHSRSTTRWRRWTGLPRPCKRPKLFSLERIRA